MAALNGRVVHDKKRVGYRVIFSVMFIGVLALGLLVYFVVRHEELRSLVKQLFCSQFLFVY